MVTLSHGCIVSSVAQLFSTVWCILKTVAKPAFIALIEDHGLIPHDDVTGLDLAPMPYPKHHPRPFKCLRRDALTSSGLYMSQTSPKPFRFSYTHKVNSYAYLS